eukprot:scaffold4309_cov215-Pinguiococcus_pyrenoidosus.AAC.4
MAIHGILNGLRSFEAQAACPEPVHPERLAPLPLARHDGTRDKRRPLEMVRVDDRRVEGGDPHVADDPLALADGDGQFLWRIRLDDEEAQPFGHGEGEGFRLGPQLAHGLVVRQLVGLRRRSLRLGRPGRSGGPSSKERRVVAHELMLAVGEGALGAVSAVAGLAKVLADALLPPGIVVATREPSPAPLRLLGIAEHVQGGGEVGHLGQLGARALHVLVAAVFALVAEALRIERALLLLLVRVVAPFALEGAAQAVATLRHPLHHVLVEVAAGVPLLAQPVHPELAHGLARIAHVCGAQAGGHIIGFVKAVLDREAEGAAGDHPERTNLRPLLP